MARNRIHDVTALGRLLCDLIESGATIRLVDDGRRISVLWRHGGRSQRLAERVKAHKPELVELLKGRGAGVAGFWALLHPADEPSIEKAARNNTTGLP